MKGAPINLEVKTHLAFMMSLCLDLPLLLQTVHNILGTPANLVGPLLDHM